MDLTCFGSLILVRISRYQIKPIGIEFNLNLARALKIFSQLKHGLVCADTFGILVQVVFALCWRPAESCLGLLLVSDDLIFKHLILVYAHQMRTY